MEFIYTEIKNAASTGKNSVFYYQSISGLQMIELRENGKTQFTYSECLVIRDMLAERLGAAITIDDIFA